MTSRPLALLAALVAGSGCHPCDPSALDYAPQLLDDWAVSTPAAEGLESDVVDQLYCEAERLDRLYGLLVVKNGKLVAEDYYNAGSLDELSSRASVTKSYTSALVGLAIEQGCVPSIHTKMLDYFPEVVDDIEDPRKKQITIGQMLEMRDGYPWEEADPGWWAGVVSGDYLPLIADVPLTADPGTIHQYSNLTSNWLAIIVARACDTDLQPFAQEHLFTPIGAEIGSWLPDADGYRMGAFELQVTARDMAKFGQLYLDDGMFEGEQVVPAQWVRDSTRAYSAPSDALTSGPEFREFGYGYQWWSAWAGDHAVDFAWGHGGNFIFLVQELDLVVVVTADPFTGEHSARSWKNERAHLNLVGEFISNL